MAENRSDDSPVVHQALYRRYRPQRFADLVGQEHVSEPLKAAVRDGRVTHAYLFSGPRGTGKTTTARILAMALNCQQPSDGEPCGECESCQSIRNGTSMDVIELDAASNRKLDDIRDIIRSASLATAGHWRVFILDEVHQLDRHAVPALLKTLEEPPPHVVFVLATTDPQEVLPTVRSRTQHFEFRLLPNEVLRQLVDDVCGAADIELDDASRDVVVRRGRGSARDALSALDQVAALGQVSEDDTAHAMNIVRACSLHAADAALTGLANAFAAGRSARALGEEIVRVLRQALLCGVAPSAADVSEEEMLVYKQFVDGLTLAGVTRAIELVGVALSEMREALDQRIPLEVAIVRVCRAGADDLASLEARVAVLESGGVVVVNAQQAASVADTAGTQTEVDEPPRNPGASTATLDDVRKELRKSVDTPTRTSTPQRALPAKDSLEPTEGPQTKGPAKAALGAAKKDVKPKVREPETAPEPQKKSSPKLGSVPSRETLTMAWGDQILGALEPRARARFRPGRWIAVEGSTATFALPDTFVKPASAEVPSVSNSLSEFFGTNIDVVVVADGEGASRIEEDDHLTREEVQELPSASTGQLASPSELLKKAFPGAEEVEG